MCLIHRRKIAFETSCVFHLGSSLESIILEIYSALRLQLGKGSLETIGYRDLYKWRRDLRDPRYRISWYRHEAVAVAALREHYENNNKISSHEAHKYLDRLFNGGHPMDHCQVYQCLYRHIK